MSYSGPPSTSKVDLGIDKVDNVADINKPVSTPQQAAIAARASATEILTNKTIQSLVISDPNDPTKQAQFLLTNVSPNSARTYALPDSNGTLALIADIYTLVSAVGNYTVQPKDHLILSPGGSDVTITLPAPSTIVLGKAFHIKSTGNPLKVNTVAGAIDGSSSVTINNKGSIQFVSDGSNYWIL